MATRPLIHAPLFVILAALSSGCGTSRPRDLPMPDGPVALPGFTVAAPVGDGWRFVSQSADSAVFERSLADGATLTAVATLYPRSFDTLEECRASLQREEYVTSPTLTDPHGDVTLVGDAGPPHVRVRFGARSADRLGPSAAWSLVDTEFRWFLRPSDGRAVMLGFSVRRPEGTPLPACAGQAGLFFRSLRFEPAANR
jgi:hypothetical protein